MRWGKMGWERAVLERWPPEPPPACCTPLAASRWHPTTWQPQPRSAPHLQHAIGLPQHGPLVGGEVDHAVGAGEEETKAHLHHHLVRSVPPAAAQPVAQCRIQPQKGQFPYSQALAQILLGFFPFLTRG